MREKSIGSSEDDQCSETKPIWPEPPLKNPESDYGFVLVRVVEAAVFAGCPMQ
jgi:hypothetical protein